MNWLELVGWIGSALLIWSLLQTRILRLRALNLVGCLILIGYNAAVQVWPMVGLNVVLAVINVWYLRKLLATRHDEQTYRVVEVGTGDAFLAHTLRVHGADIARFNPDFHWDPAADRSAFLVVRADEVVGVVVSHAEADGVAQIDLDYVTQRFRDFTPGEFVYRRSRLFTDRGFRRVVSPPGMVAPYYHRLGFRPEGDAYVLDLPEAASDAVRQR
ncbi:YgjV family protein [Micromonospora narathiwatensis]|uniref:Inner membrane protein n=1 Tax=Micromonospora narathiwatensis TaxID=299146 RepID=A0A1A8Z8N7_9ACTN|nr:YgjV family protein [Micromonospora narathiwatensis]SBT40226.1 inner membrane protein [Micromonospora narathiwatensis]